MRVKQLIKSSSGAYWTFITVIVILSITIAHYLGKYNVPSAIMLTGIFVGIFISLGFKLDLELTKSSSIATSAMMGVLMGTYMQFNQIRNLPKVALPLLLLSLFTVVLGVIASIVLVKFSNVDKKTAILGVLPGGSSAVISSAKEVSANIELVAFMQYLRVAIVASTTPLVFLFIRKFDSAAAYIPPQSNAVFITNYLKLVTRGDQLAGLSVAIVLAIVGVKVGKTLRLPAPTLLGPLIISAIVTSLQISHGYTPTALFKDIIYVMIGLEVGLKFTRKSLKTALKILPLLLLIILALCAVTGIMAVIVAKYYNFPLSDAYLATTPGGINAVIGIAESNSNNMTVITTIQASRMLLAMLSIPALLFIAKKLPDRKHDQTSQSNSTGS